MISVVSKQQQQRVSVSVMNRNDLIKIRDTIQEHLDETES